MMSWLEKYMMVFAGFGIAFLVVLQILLSNGMHESTATKFGNPILAVWAMIPIVGVWRMYKQQKQ